MATGFRVHVRGALDTHSGSFAQAGLSPKERPRTTGSGPLYGVYLGRPGGYQPSTDTLDLLLLPGVLHKGSLPIVD